MSTPRTQLLQQGPLFLALLLSAVGLYVVVLFLGRLLDAAVSESVPLVKHTPIRLHEGV